MTEIFSNSAFDIWNTECSLPAIITLSKQFDKSLNNGIQLGILTEICGGPGSGKTQLAFQLCVNVQIPKDVGGIGGSAIFIDTNRGFSSKRIKEIAFASSERCKIVYEKYNIQSTSFTYTVDNILKNIYYSYITDYIKLIAAIQHIKKLLIKNESNIRLIVIDSLSYLFRSTIENSLQRRQILTRIITDLQMIGNKYQCAILITNELTTRFLNSNTANLVPSLGDSHAHKITQQILLDNDLSRKGVFFANIRKALYSPDVTIAFQIIKDGIRDVT